MSFDLIERGDPDRVDTGVVSANFFNVLGIQPILGRSFVAADESHGAEAVLILSHWYWQSRFGGDPHIVGRVFQMNDRPHTVIGVLPAVPQYPRECDVYMPTSACPFRARGEERMAANRRAFGLLRVFGRLKPGVTHPHAAAQVALVGERFRRDYPEVYPDGQGFRATTVGVLPELTRNARPMLLMLLGATALVLLIACTNVVSLTVARTLNRDRELAMRTALGASRRHLVAQLLTESLLLAVSAGRVGLAIAQLTLGGLTTFIGRFTARTGEVTIDGSRAAVHDARVRVERRRRRRAAGAAHRQCPGRRLEAGGRIGRVLRPHGGACSMRWWWRRLPSRWCWSRPPGCC